VCMCVENVFHSLLRRPSPYPNFYSVRDLHTIVRVSYYSYSICAVHIEVRACRTRVRNAPSRFDGTARCVFKTPSVRVRILLGLARASVETTGGKGGGQ